MFPRRADHARAALRLALDLHAACADVMLSDDAADGTPPTAVRIRVGLHSGPVSSGVVGHVRARFCLFGGAPRLRPAGCLAASHLSNWYALCFCFCFCFVQTPSMSRLGWSPRARPAACSCPPPPPPRCACPQPRCRRLWSWTSRAKACWRCTGLRLGAPKLRRCLPLWTRRGRQGRAIASALAGAAWGGRATASALAGAAWRRPQNSGLPTPLQRRQQQQQQQQQGLNTFHYDKHPVVKRATRVRPCAARWQVQRSHHDLTTTAAPPAHPVRGVRPQQRHGVAPRGSGRAAAECAGGSAPQGRSCAALHHGCTAPALTARALHAALPRRSRPRASARPPRRRRAATACRA